MSIIGKKLPEFTLDAFKKPELVKVSTADVLGKWSVFVIYYPADFTFCNALQNWKTYKNLMLN